MERWLNNIWYEPRGIVFVLLWPLSVLYRLLSGVRRLAYQTGLLKSYRLAVPTIVVGNLTAGGTGKTPLVLWLIETLRARGVNPGVMSRGYRSVAGAGPLVVTPQMSAGDCGDEPLMIFRRVNCPVVAGSDRIAAGRKLIELGCDVLISDDGLQHQRLHRDLELLVVDGRRGFGNGGLIPAGPLREGISRLDTVDAVVVNGDGSDIDGAMTMRLQGNRFWRLDGSDKVGPDRFTNSVHAVAGIGNPQRFFDALQAMGLEVVPHRFPDHFAFDRDSLEFGDGLETIMTEKDAARCNRKIHGKAWYLPVDAKFAPEHDAALRTLLDRVIQST